MTLLDATDRTLRPLQHGTILAAILLLLLTPGFLDSPDRRPLAGVTAGVSVLLFGIATQIRQRWNLTYKGHRIRYVNNALLGERLWLDDQLAGKGKFGIKSEICATIASGDGAGETIVAQSTAGFLTFQCRIMAQPAAAKDAASALSDAALLEEVRRRGL